VLSPDAAVSMAEHIHGYHIAERHRLDIVRRYWKGLQRLPAVIPRTAPREVRVMARSSRINVMPIVVNSLVQSTFVDGFRGSDEDEDHEVWSVWQANRMDARQTAIHRAAYAYGTAYAVVLPGDPAPIIHGVSPRSMTSMYGESPDWPDFALWRRDRNRWALLDSDAVYEFAGGEDGKFQFVGATVHGAPVTPVVRYVDEHDLDDDDEVSTHAQALIDDQYEVPTLTRGQVAPLIPLQDQIDLTTFGLQIAQHYGAFRQRYIIGWAAQSEQEAVKAAASQVWTFDEDPSSITLGEFDQTNLAGYIESREASLRHAATLSQTPAHELVGELVNLSAEALAAAEAGRDRKVDERQTNHGESHEQLLWVAGWFAGVDVPGDGQVVWRDTSARAFSATVDALGKLSQMLGVPPQELWERIPGVTRQDVERWKATAERGDAFSDLVSVLERQSAPAPMEA